MDGGMKEITERFSVQKTTIGKNFQDYREEISKVGLYPDSQKDCNSQKPHREDHVSRCNRAS